MTLNIVVYFFLGGCLSHSHAAGPLPVERPLPDRFGLFYLARLRIIWYSVNMRRKQVREMTILKVSEARGRLGRLVDEAAASHEPVLITGKRGNAVLVSEDDWRAIQETLYLLSIPGMRESIREGLQTPVAECTRELDW